MAQLMSPNGPIPVQCVIEGAKTLSEAADKLPDAIEKYSPGDDCRGQRNGASGIVPDRYARPINTRFDYD